MTSGNPAGSGVTNRRWRGGVSPPPGFQRHHLIPLSLHHRAGLDMLFVALQKQGFDLRRWSQNGLLLPASEVAALATGHALHRGPHPAYDEIVRARLDAMLTSFVRVGEGERARAARDIKGRLVTMQAALRRLLTDCHGLGGWSIRLNRRDPMRLFADRPYLDCAIDRAFADLGGNIKAS